MLRIRHCKCRHMPENPEHLRAALSPVGLSAAHLNSVVRVLYSQPADSRRHDRALTHVSAPDEHGHMRWIGPVPLNSGPRVQYQGLRIPVALWVWLRAGRPDPRPDLTLAGDVGTVLVRTCHDPQCIAVAHHALEQPSAPTQVGTLITHADLAQFDAARPRINPRPKRWDTSEPTGERCLRAGHPLTIYGDPRLRRTYCRLCAHDERKRIRDRSSIEARLMRTYRPISALDYSPAPAALDLDAIPDGPTLVDQYLAELGDVD